MAKHYEAPEVLKLLWQDIAKAHYAATLRPPAPSREGRAYDPSEAFTHPLDFQIAREGGAALFWSREVLTQAVDWFVAAGYHLVRIDSADWHDRSGAHDAIASALKFPSYYGRNLDALADCLADVARGDYGWPDDSAGLLVVFENYHVPLERERRFAEAVLDIFTGCSSDAALVGNRVLCLAQTNDPGTVIGSRRARSVSWNPAEFFDRTRGL